jgi:hypothetical protein
VSAELALRVEMLARLESAGALTATGLDLSSRPDLSFEQYGAIGALLGRGLQALRWAIGDWLCFGEEVFGELAAEASEALGVSPEGRMELCRVARAVPRSQRRPGLSWTHHRAVARRSLAPNERRELLDRAEVQGWNARELEAAVRSFSGSDDPSQSDCDVRFERGVDGLRRLARECYGSDVVLEVHVRGPGFELVERRAA